VPAAAAGELAEDSDSSRGEKLRGTDWGELETPLFRLGLEKWKPICGKFVVIDCLAEEGSLEEVSAKALKRLLAVQIDDVMEEHEPG